MAGQPKPTFYVVVGVVVVALIGFAIWRLSPKPTPAPTDQEKLVIPGLPPAEEPEKKLPGDAAPGALTFDKFEFVPAQTLPPVTGASDYLALSKNNNTVRFSINTWAGWGPIILANEGFKPGKVWKTPKGDEFKVELVKVDDIVAMRDLFTSGKIHIGWATLDMVPLLLETMVHKDGTPRDDRYMPRIYQQIDWSSGGDGIVVREGIKTVADLKGKKVVLAQNSPSEYFALRMLVSAGLQPNEVEWTYTRDAFQAATAFRATKDLSGCVSWAPDIYTLTKDPGNRMLVTTAQANKLIADVWFTRADFARDHPGIIEGLVRGIFDAMEEMDQESSEKREAVKKRVAKLMAEGYELKPGETEGMLGDAHSTNWAENREFFLNKNNPTNFQRVWETAYAVYSHPRVGRIKHRAVPFDQVMDYRIIDKLGQEEKYKKQIDKSVVQFSPLPTTGPVEGPEILGNRFYIRFAPNSPNPYEKVIRTVDGMKVEQYVDVNVEKVMEEIAQMVGTFGAARIIIEGHTDSSKRAEVLPQDLAEWEAAVKELSEKRAQGVKDALLKNNPKFQPNQISPRGLGFSRPADPANPNNHALNRRVEVRIYSAE